MPSTKKSWKLQLFKKKPVENAPPTIPELLIPTHFRCPISLDLMKDPVTLSTGITYDRPSIEKWLELGNSTCPVTKQALGDPEELVPNRAILKLIQDWCVANRGFGVDRIPTPKIPVTDSEATGFLTKLSYASQRRDEGLCVDLVKTMVARVKESEKNRRTFTASGAARVLAETFHDSAVDRRLSKVNAVVLSALTLFPLDEGVFRFVGSPESLGAIVGVLNSGDLAGRLSAVLVLKELLASSDSDRIDAVAATEGLVESLVKLVERPISPNTTKASLVNMFYLCSSNVNTAEKFVRMGLVPVLVEIVVDSDKSTTEKALAVLDATFTAQCGREEALRNALTLPVLVKKIVRVSDTATEFAVSALWRLCKSLKGGDCLFEALENGVFQKLLLVLQVGCKSSTKERVSDLLKMSKGSRANLECIETLDFKGLKRPF